MSAPLALGSVSVLAGRDGWLFLNRAGDRDVLGLYTDEAALDGATIHAWREALSRRREYFESRGITYQTLVVPEAHGVYRDKLPDAVRLAERSPFKRLYDALDAGAQEQCVYLLDVLVTGRQHRETYQSVNGSWTDWGAWLGYQASVGALAWTVPGIRVLDDADLDWSERPMGGPLGAAVTPEGSATMPALTVRKPASRLTISAVTELRQTFLVVEQDAPDLPTAVVFRDSHMTTSAKFFSESFRRTTFVESSNSIYYDLVGWAQPDVVIHELSESSLVVLPNEPSTSDFRSVFGDLMLDDPLALADQRRSRSLARVGRVVEALAASDDVLGRVPPDARLLVQRAGLHLQAGHVDAAIEALRHATTIDPDDAAPWCLLGQLLAQQGRAQDSAAAYSKAAHAEPQYPVYLQLAMSGALIIRDLAGAEELRTEAAQRHPDNAALANAASWVLAAQGRLEEAEESAARAVALEPDAAEHLQQLAAVQIRREQWQAAEKTLAELGRRVPDHPAVVRYVELVRNGQGARSDSDVSERQ